MDGGFLSILKPPGMTSHDVVSYIRRTYSIKRVGHAGTLDPAAAGVLPIAIGQATRLLEYLAADDKSYRVEMTLGYETDTGDDTGSIIEYSTDLCPNRKEIERVLFSFIGNIEQVPPMYSAIKVDGKRLYELARNGVTIERKTRSITISNIELLDIVGNRVLFDVACSKGTYIRSLCIDIGRKLGCLATMTFLLRTRVGQFTVQDSKTLEELSEGPLEAIVSPDCFIKLPAIELESQQAAAFKNGRTIEYNTNGKGLFKIYDSVGTFVGIGKKENSIWLKPVKVLSSIKQQ
ncbi:MAG: tRNA pseudouridine(55) synthase TruB [Veillonellaceae bacterium]|jgi:tRNA pseudouridine55 synthase|nr:tRNA pseudouridine(55) synthase TruB [Veillonellaceae bacterium]